MSILNGLVAGTTAAMGDDTLLNREKDNRARKQQFSDDYRKSEIARYMSSANNMQKALALMIHPDTMQPLEGKEQQVAQLRQQLGQVDSRIKQLYDPNFNPETGTINEDPIHKLTDKLHLTHAPEANKTAAQQMTDLKGITERYGESGTATAGIAQGEQKQKIDAARELMKKYGMSDQAIQDITEKMMGVTPHAQKEQKDLLQGTVNGSPVSWLKDKYSGDVTDLAGNPIPSDQLEQFQATPKNQPKPRKGWGKDANGKFFSVLLDPFTNKEVPNSRNFDEQPPSNLTGRITTGFYHFVDENGNVHQVQETRTSMPAGSSGKSGSDTTAPFTPPSNVKGMLVPGNINLGGRPILHNGDGSISSERSFSIGTDQGEVLIPRIFDGKDHTEQEAIEHYRQTGQHLGIFDTPEHADAYAQAVHNRRTGGSPSGSPKSDKAPKKTGDKILGHKDTPEAVAAKKIADVLKTDADTADAHLKNRTPSGDTSIVMSWVRSQVRGAGRMTNVEIEQGLKSGSWGTQFSNAYSKALEGTLDDEFVSNMVKDIHVAADAARSTADQYKSGSSSGSSGTEKKDTRKPLSSFGQ